MIIIIMYKLIIVDFYIFKISYFKLLQYIFIIIYVYLSYGNNDRILNKINNFMMNTVLYIYLYIMISLHLVGNLKKA